MGKDGLETNFSDSQYYDYDLNGGNEELEVKQRQRGTASTPEDIYPDPEKLYQKVPRFEEVAAVMNNERDVQIGDDIMKLQASNFVLGESSSSGGSIKSKSIMKSRGTSNKNDVDYELMDSIDQDFKGHDLIDSIMYIYYGSNNNTALRTEVGGNIIVIGAVVALAAQILTIILLFLKNRRQKHKNQILPVIMPLLIMTLLSNFTFVVGVQSSRNVYKCEIIAILLHYLHLSTTFWDFLYIFCIHDFIKNNIPPNLHFLISMGFGMPGLYIVFNYIISSSNYEINNYCWMSVKKGMIVNYMIPISFFIVLTAVYGTMCLRLLRIKQREQFTESIESFIEHSKSEQMLNQVRHLENQNLNIQHMPIIRQANNHPPQHRALGRCHSNPSTTTHKKVSLANLKANTMANSSINLTGTSPSRLSTLSLNNSQPHLVEKIHCSEAVLANSIDHNMHKDRSFCESMIKRRGFCDSKYELGSLSLANLSLQSLSSESEDFEDYKSAVKFAILFQIMFSICWFFAVIALEYKDTSVMPIVFVIVHNLMNWIMLAKSNSICPLMTTSLVNTTSTPMPEYQMSQKSAISKLRDCEEGKAQNEEKKTDKVEDNPLIAPYEDEDYKRKVSTDTIPLLYSTKSTALRANHLIPDSTTIESTLPLDCDNSVIDERSNTQNNSPQPVSQQNKFHWDVPSTGETSPNPEFISTIST